MPIVRVFQNLSGTVRVMHLNERHRLPGETDDQFFARETAKQTELLDLPFADVERASLPNDRNERYKWRLKDEKVIVDASVPDRAHPKQALLNEISAANSVAQLKAVLEKLVRDVG